VGCSPGRVLLSRTANALARAALGLSTHDGTAGFRCYRAEVLRSIGLDTLFSSGYSFLVEVAARCERHGFRIGELPIVFEKRTCGRSKISRGEIWKGAKTIWRLSWERRLPQTDVRAAVRRTD